MSARSRHRHLHLELDMVTPAGRQAFARALRLLAAKEGGHATYVDEFAHVVNELFLGGEPVQETPGTLKLVEALACLADLTIDVAIAEIDDEGGELSRLDVLTALQRAIESQVGPISEAG